MIRWLHVRNFRSLRDARIEFTSPFMAVIGANNTGKTSLLHALDVVRRLAHNSLPDVFQSLYPLDATRTQGCSEAMELAIALDYPEADGAVGQFEYRLAVTSAGRSAVASVEEEELAQAIGGTRRLLVSRRRGQDDWVFLNERTGSQEPFHGEMGYHAVSQLRDLIAHKSILQFRAALGSAWLFDLQPHLMKGASQVMALPVLTWDGSNLAAVLDAMRSGYPQPFESMRHDLSRIVPEIRDVLLRAIDGGRKFVAFREEGLPSDVYSFQASDGVLRTVAMLAALHSPESPYLLMIEEPENGIHPRRLELLVDCFRRYARTGPDGVPRQVLITTHSPYLLDKLRPEEILVATRGGNGTEIAPLPDAEKVKQLLEETPLGELWHSGSIGGVPAP